MLEADKVFSDSIPEIYDRYLVPLIFEAFAADLAGRVAASRPGHVLETAAGSGVVTRALAPLLGPDARYVASDLNQPMLQRAIDRQGKDKRIDWRQADALALPFDDASFDVLCCQFGVMFFPDRVAGYREARRVLKPGGRFLFNAWDAIEHNDLARMVTDAAAKIFPTDPPRFLARTPHGYHDVAAIVDDLRTADFVDIEVETLARPSTAPGPRDPAIAYCQGTPLRNEILARAPAGLGEVTDRIAEAIAAACGDGPVSGKVQAHVVVATV
ncbi:class I SAM-dependent methyltransferase [Oceanibacterium hippocampi]|uniref:class I SAM-dependent methyltransferase n=1 Tax=Oceanibacterium hippocampi TaxID=745714 RepID=UPI000A267810